MPIAIVKSFLPLICIAAAVSASVAAEPSRLAIAGFDFRDTSGEVRDQVALHEARLKAFDTTLHHALAGNPEIRLVPLACGADPCTPRKSGLDSLSAKAKTDGTRYLLVGEVHKMSTLVGWVKFAVLDLNDNKPVCDRTLTYRGDTDEAWRRAADFAAHDIAKNCIP